MTNPKNILFAYFFAIIGGLFGFHHIYLGRTQHALLWFTTFGGFGIGLIYELFVAIKGYVDEANHHPSIFEKYHEKFRQEKSPAFELRRLVGKSIH
jgi:DnaJ homolog subfamily C member 22